MKTPFEESFLKFQTALHWLQAVLHSTMSTEVETASVSFGRKENYLEKWSAPVNLSGVFPLCLMSYDFPIKSSKDFRDKGQSLSWEKILNTHFPIKWFHKKPNSRPFGALKIRIHTLPSSYQQSCRCY